MINYLINLIKTILQLFPSDTFKIVDITGNTHKKNVEITYQVNGKSIITTEKSFQLVESLMFIKGFSKKDSQTILELALNERIAPIFKIISIHFIHEPIKFEIEDIISKYTFLLTASELVSTDKIIENFSTKDISIIYFQLAKEQEHNNLQQKLSLIKNNPHEKNIYFLHKKNDL